MPIRCNLSLIALILFITAPLAQAERTCPARFANFNREELEKLVLSDTDRNLFDEQMSIGTAEEAEFWNRTLIDAVDGLPRPKPTANRLPSLNPEQRANLLKLVDKHPVADSRFYDKYAPEGGTGFCFGRAITAHIEALRMGLDKESIKKIWIVGAMEGTSDSWGHHVATIVRGPNGKWYTIDPNYDTPLTLLAWQRRVASDYKNDGRLQLFVTNPQRFGPEEGVNAGPMLPSTVSDPFYHNFFEDLMRQSRGDAKQMFEQKRLERGYCPITSAPRIAKAAAAATAAPKRKSFRMNLKDRVLNGVENCLTEILKRLPERE